MNECNACVCVYYHHLRYIIIILNIIIMVSRFISKFPMPVFKTSLKGKGDICVDVNVKSSCYVLCTQSQDITTMGYIMVSNLLSMRYISHDWDYYIKCTCFACTRSTQVSTHSLILPQHVN